MDWYTILTSLGLSAGVGAAIVAFGGKVLVNWWIDRGKLKLQKKLDGQLETHKAELVRTTNELQERLRIEYGSLYQERLNAIKIIYTRLFEIELQIREFSPTSPAISCQEELDDVCTRSKALASSIKKLDMRIGLSLIYFTEYNAATLLSLMEQLKKFIQAYNEWMHDEMQYACDPIYHALKELKSAQTQKQLQTIRGNFRKLVGVTE